MAIAASSPVAGLFSTANANTYTMTAFTPTANSFLVVFVIANTSNGTSGTMSGGSLTWTKSASVASSDSGYIFTAPVGASPVSTAPSVTGLDVSPTGCEMMCVQFTGHDTTTPIAQTKTGNTATSTNAFVTFAANVNANNGYACQWGGLLGSTGVSTPPTGWTEGDDSGISSPTRNASSAYRAGGESTATFTFTNASTTWASSGIEINVASASIPNKAYKKNIAVARASLY